MQIQVDAMNRSSHTCAPENRSGRYRLKILLWAKLLANVSAEKAEHALTSSAGMMRVRNTEIFSTNVYSYRSAAIRQTSASCVSDGPVRFDMPTWMDIQ